MKRIILSIGIAVLLSSSFSCLLAERNDPDDPSFGGFFSSAEISPRSGSDIKGNEDIVIIFSDEMDRNSLSITGDIDVSNAILTWSTTVYPDDTVTLSPDRMIFADGVGRTINVDGCTKYGTQLPTLTATYNVSYGLRVRGVDPLSGSDVSGDSSITIKFSESMDTESISLTGDINLANANLVWTSEFNQDDVLTINPTNMIFENGTGRTLAVNGYAAFGPPLETETIIYNVNYGARVKSEEPLSGTDIQGDETIVIRFTEPMDTSSIVITGDINLANANLAWSTFDVPNDTLTITPTGVIFDKGAGKTLVVNGYSAFGPQLETKTITYNVNYGARVLAESPVSGLDIPGDGLIQIWFTESMDPGSVTLTGDINLANATLAWSTAEQPNDKLTITPTGMIFANGTGKTLVVNGYSAFGPQMDTRTITYNVNYGARVQSESPVSGSDIPGTGAIAITFNKSMNTGSVVITGDINLTNATLAWSTYNVLNDKLTITPTSMIFANGTGKTLVVNGYAAFGPPLETKTITYNVDYGLSATITPGSGSTIAGHEPIKIVFNQSMATSSVVLTGDINTGLITKTWSTTTNTNDTLTISVLNPASPAAFWDAGSGKTITINGNSVFGPALPEFTATYTVENRVYVKTTGNDANIGTSGSPVATIPMGIALVQTVYGANPSKVLVAQGTYHTNWGANTNRIVMVDGVSLYGGYSTDDWTLRDTVSYVTTIQDDSTSVGQTNNTNRAIDCGNNVSNSTIIDGFTIYAGGGGEGSYSAALFCFKSSPTINNCVIDGGSSASRTYGIYNYHDNTSTIPTNPILTNNTIRGGIPPTGFTTRNSRGIYNFGNGGEYCMPVIKNNIRIYGGDGKYSHAIYNISTLTATILIQGNKIEGGIDYTKSNETYGIYNYNSSPSIINNTIYAGMGSSILHGIDIQAGSAPKIYNNTIDGGGTSNPTTRACCIFINGGSDNLVSIKNNILTFASNVSLNNKGWGIYESSTTSNPLCIEYNDVFNYGLAYLYRNNYGGTLRDFSYIFSGNFTLVANDLGLPGEWQAGVNNKNEGPVFASTGDGFHLSSSSPTSLKMEGVDLSGEAYFPKNANGDAIDKDGIVRGSEWSIGAYEY